jgi:hypothetical protein
MSRHASLAICIGVILTATSAESSQEAQADTLTLAIRAQTAAIVTGEPLSVTALLRNESKQTAQVPTGIMGTLKFFCHFEAESLRLCAPGKSAGADYLGQITLASGEAIGSDEPLFLRTPAPDAVIFDRPGRYTLIAQVTLGSHDLRSRPVTVTVAPALADDVAAAAWIHENKLARMIQGWGGSDTAATRLAEFVTRFPSSVFADYAYVALGEYYAAKYHEDPANDYGTHALRAFGYFARVSERVEGLRRTAVHARGELAWSSLQVRAIADIAELVRQLDAGIASARVAGADKDAQDLRARLVTFVK